MDTPADTQVLLAEYRETLVSMDGCRVERGGDPRRWNRLVNRAQSLHLRLSETAEGRAGITGLIDDDVTTVRQWSAVNALAWDEQIARAELERVAADNGPGAFNARIALREFDAGRLNTTWQPK